MNFAQVKKVTIPQGNVKRILQGSMVLWKIPYVLKTLTGTLPITFTAVKEKIESLKQFGKVVQNGTPTPESPVDVVCNNGAVKWDSTNQRIYADGTPEVLTVGGVDNFPSRDGETARRIIGSAGVITENSNYSVSEPFQLSAGSYICTWNVGSGARPFGIWECDAEGNVDRDGMIFYRASSVAGVNEGSFTLTAPKLAMASYRSNAKDLSIVRAPQTATVPDLYAVGDYKDEADIISGAVTRKVGVKVLDGTESWYSVTGYADIYGLAVADGIFTINQLCVSTHYVGTIDTNASMKSGTIKAVHASVLAPKKVSVYIKDSTNGTSLAAWKSYLAAQYANGTPVIVLYPLATDTSESVPAQPLNTAEGTNVVDATANAANATGIEATVQYYAES